jgi:hypothetical protein
MNDGIKKSNNKKKERCEFTREKKEIVKVEAAD